MIRFPPLHLVWAGENIAQALVRDFPTQEHHRPRLSRLGNRLRCLRQLVLRTHSTRLTLMALSVPSARALPARKTVGGAEGQLRPLFESLVTRRNEYFSAPSAPTPLNRSTIGPGTRNHCTFRWRNGYVHHWGKYMSMEL